MIKTRWFRENCKLWCLCAFIIALIINNFAAANPAHHTDNNFTECVSMLSAKAQLHGISKAIIKQVLGEVKFLPKVIKLDRRQPEFSQIFADYFNTRINEDRIKHGKKLLANYRHLLNKIQKETGVPAQYLIAFWGLESNYGNYLGNISVLNALATLACDQRRQVFFTDELLNALRIIDIGDISAEHMVGSWAGAMGHMQFMPSTYLQFAHDGDGDGRRDLWNSVPDALVSAGYFLQKLGWKPDQHWGQEVSLASTFDYMLAGRNQSHTIQKWLEFGITPILGTSLLPIDQKASLLVPAGHKGPAFLIYKNFNVIMDWNHSEFYALTVGHLADRIAGAQALHRSPPTDSLKLTRKQVRQLQLDLTKLGIDAGKIDGILGPDTRHALSSFQQRIRRIADGNPDPELLIAIRNAAKNRSHQPSTTETIRLLP